MSGLDSFLYHTLNVHTSSVRYYIEKKHHLEL